MIQLFLVFSDWGILILRVVVGLIFVGHGWPKIKDLKTTASNFEGMGFKPGKLWGTLVALLEFLGGIALIVGFFTQIVALLFAIEFAVILLTVKRKSGFVGGYEFELLLFAAVLLLTLIGGGAWSVDNALGFLLF